MVLLVGAGLLVTSLVKVLDVDPGFDLRQGLVADVSLPASAYPDADRRARFFDDAIARVEALPGVARACAISRVPLSGTPFGLTYVPEHQTRSVGALPLSVTPSCFATLGVALTRGRLFGPDEPAPAAVVSETMARQMWPGEDPVGKRMHVGLPDGDLLTVVGVARDIHSVTLEGDSPRQVWLPPGLGVFPPSHLIVRTAVPPATLAAPVRAAVRAVDPDLPVANVRTMAEVLSATLSARRFDLLLLGSFALTALVLCGVGIYGLLAQLVGRRTHRSACAWRSARRRRRWSGWWWAARRGPCWPARPPGSQPRGRRRASCATCCSRCRRPRPGSTPPWRSWSSSSPPSRRSFRRAGRSASIRSLR